MNIYRISQTVNTGQNNQYGCYYDSAVVLAESEEEARKIVPGGDYDDLLYGWTQPENVEVELIGKTVGKVKVGTNSIICESFNPG